MNSEEIDSIIEELKAERRTPLGPRLPANKFLIGVCLLGTVYGLYRLIFAVSMNQLF